MSKVLLVSFFNTEAYGLRQLHSILRNEGHDAKMVFLKGAIGDRFEGVKSPLTDKEMNLFVSLVKKQKPDFIGFSLVSSNFTLYKKVYERIRGLSKIIVGGWQASLNPEETKDYCDFLCIGEGEEFIKEVVRGEEPKTHPLIEDLSIYPVHIFDNDCYFIENNELLHKDPYMDSTRYGTTIGRGCPFQCTYCSNSFMTNIYPNWGKVRYRTIDHVMKELNEAKKLPKVERINFYNEVFLQGDMVEEFSKRYKEEIGLPFYCMFYPGFCTDENARLLKEAGLVGVWLGIQSGSERVRKEIFKRNYTNEKIMEQVEIFKKHGIGVKYDFIFDNPFESFDESLESIDMMCDFPTPYMLNLFSLKYFPNTKITSMALDARLISPRDLNDHLTEDHQNYLIVKGIKHPDKEFVNCLATYVSCMASKSELDRQLVDDLICEYIKTLNIEPVIGLLKDRGLYV